MKTEELKNWVLRGLVWGFAWLWVRHYWGPRCEHRAPGCPCCDAWVKVYEVLDVDPGVWPLDVEDSQTGDQV